MILGPHYSLFIKFLAHYSLFIIKKPIIHLSLYPRGGTQIFSYIRRLGPFFGGQIFEFQYYFGFSEK